MRWILQKMMSRKNARRNPENATAAKGYSRAVLERQAGPPAGRAVAARPVQVEICFFEVQALQTAFAIRRAAGAETTTTAARGRPGRGRSRKNLDGQRERPAELATGRGIAFKELAFAFVVLVCAGFSFCS